jgi:hypothetical protein
MKLTITIEPEDIRNYDIAVDWSDTQVSNFIERWQQSINDSVTDSLLCPEGILDNFMNDPDCTSWATKPGSISSWGLPPR